MSAVTISRQLGSLGRDIAVAVGQRLHYRVVHREIINQAAREAGAPEVALAAIDELGLLNLCPSPRACHAYHNAVRQVMEQLAEDGRVVILGRAGQAVLRGRADVLHVRIFAPEEVRIERIAQRHRVSKEAAAAQVEASDRHRKNYLRRFYHVRWDDPDLYDLTVNTERLCCEAAAEIIAAAVPQLKKSR